MSLLVFGGVFREAIVDESGSREVRFAGSALYAAVAASRLGASVTMLAPVGSEDVALTEALAAEAGIDVELIVAPGATGTFAYERVSGLLLARGYRPADSRSPLEITGRLGQPEISLIFGHPEYDASKSSALAEVVSSRPLLFDRQGWMSATPTLAAALDLPASRHTSLSNTGELREEFRAVPDLGRLPMTGFDASIAKDGRWGVHLLTQSERMSVSAYKVEHASELGSGDVFAGAFAASVLSGAPEGSALETANAAAAIAISNPGSLPGDDFASQVNQLIESGKTRPLVPPEARARTAIYLDCPFGIAGDALIDRLGGELRMQGFEPLPGNRGVVLPRIRVADQLFEFDDSDHSLLDWLQDRLE